MGKALMVASSVVTLENLRECNLFGYLSPNTAIRWTVGSLLVLTGMCSDVFFSGQNIARHSRDFISRLTCERPTLSRILGSPAKSLEVFVQMLSYMAYKGIGTAYITRQLLQVAGLSLTNPCVLPLIATSAALTVYATGFQDARTIHRTFFDPKWNTLSLDDIKNTTLNLKRWLKDIMVASSRSLGLGWICFRFGPEDLSGKIALTSAISLVSFVHTLYVMHHRHIRELAYRRRRQELISMGDHQIDFETKTPDTLFNQIREHYETTGLKRVVSVINASAGIANLISFIGFLSQLKETLGENGLSVPLNLVDLLFLTLGWGTVTVFVEKVKDKEGIIKNLTSYKAKWTVGAPTDKIKKEYFLTRGIHTLFYPAKFYDPAKLRIVDERLDQEAVAQIEKNTYQPLN